ncbi:hypothetical protein EVAR_18582_1 [Eumeta japonica]|uniref:General transcription factor II-I repeat domain-containing protein 2 n=1 Tax=Eumeta variegata TaxID=151549 RepID=A0A4C1V4A2_EUMVA|nr:hypothetical protein EVAR_18582_1 [Eumeta japonica]
MRLWEAQVLSGNDYHFTTLYLFNIAYAQYAEELKLMSEQLSNRFSDYKNMEDCFKLFTTSTKSNVQYPPTHLQMELTKIQENSLLTSKFEDVKFTSSNLDFVRFLQKIPRKRPFSAA